MPEIMISALYRAQSYLSTESLISLMKNNDSSLFIFTEVKNNSRVAGTNPKIQIQLYSEFKGLMDFKGPYIMKTHKDTGMSKTPFLDVDWINWNGILTTDNDFQQEILYPGDSLTLKVQVFSFFNNTSNRIPRYIIAKIDTMFSESMRTEKFILIDLENNEGGRVQPKQICSVDKNNIKEIAYIYHQLNINN